MFNRRNFLKDNAGLPLCAGWLYSRTGAYASTVPRDFFKELGVRTFINAGEPYTALTGSLMTPEVKAAWDYAVPKYVHLNDLHDAVGKRIASLIGCEAAMVSAGAASALTLGTAACITGTDADKIHRLPDTRGMKDEVIIQKSHRYGYDHAVRNCGIRYIEVETRQELEAAIHERTAMMHFFNTNGPLGQIKLQEFAELGKKHGIPTLNDVAADVPPLENLSKSIKLGFDLVTVSGGKGLRGPQSCGLLYGRADLIHAARLNGPPNSDAIARGQKVNKEEMLGMMVALESYYKRDHNADWREWEHRVGIIRSAVDSLKGVQSEMFVPEIHYHVPHVRITWDKSLISLTVAEVIKQLREGEPAIEVRSSPPEALELGVWLLEPGEAQMVARRLSQILRKA